MGTTNDALAGLKAQMAQLQTDYTAEKAELSQILTDVAKLVAGATILPTGQVAVSAADIAALTASATALDQSLAADTALETAADATVNPPAQPGVSPAAAAKKTGTGVNQA